MNDLDERTVMWCQVFSHRARVTVCLLLVAMLVTSGCKTNPESATGSPLSLENTLVSTPDGLVIRGGTCSADAFKRGAEHVSGDNISNLSVNCTTDTNNKAKYANYLAGIGGYTHYCVATWKSIGIVGGVVRTNPVTGNPNHCLLSGKAKEIAKKLARYR